MKLSLGTDFFEAKNGKTVSVDLDTQKLINAHALILGSSGVGKSHTFRKMIRRGTRNAPKVRFHVYDVHGDLDIPGASVVQFTEQADFGLNPLRIDPSPDSGGVRKSIQTFIRIINQSSTTALGVKQESVIRNLLLDVYRDFGFDPDDASTWSLNALESRLISGGADNRLYLEVPLSDKDAAKGFGARWDPDQKLWWVHAHKYLGDVTRWKPAFKERTYPNVKDVVLYARRIYVEKFLGADQKAVRALANLNKVARSLQRKALEAVKHRNLHIYTEDDAAVLDEMGQKAIDAFTDYVKSIRTGYELDSLLKYDNPDTLKGVLDRLSNILATGVFKQNAPPFDPRCSVWRYKLNSLLNQEEKKMVVLFLMQELFFKAMQNGEQREVTDIIVLDELSTYTSNVDEKGDGIIGIIAREARKFGIGLWAANQSTKNVPESLISSAGTKIILGIDEGHWVAATQKLRIEPKLLNWIQAHQTMAVQLKEKGTAKTRWWWVRLDDD